MSSGRLAAKTLLLTMLAYAPGCADSGSADMAEDEAAGEVGEEQVSAEARQQAENDFNGALGDARNRGESFDNDANNTTPEDLNPWASEDVGPNELKHNGPRQYDQFKISGVGRNYGGSTVFYPRQGDNLAGVVMCPGFTALRSSIAPWGPFFATHGIVLAVIDTKTTMDQVMQRGPEIIQALQDLRKEGESGRLRGRMGNRWGVSGWSMGGGGTWLAAHKADQFNIKTAVTLAGHNMTYFGGTYGVPGGTLITRGIRIPTLMMNGATDLTLLGGLNQSGGAFGNMPNGVPALHWEASGCGHFCWGTPKTARNLSGVYMMAWQKTFLEGQSQYKQFLERNGGPASINGVTAVFRKKGF